MRVKVLLLLGLIVTLATAGAACRGKKSPSEPTPVCIVTISPASLTFGSEGGAGSVVVSVAAGCAWTATSSGAWIALTSGATGSGGGTVAYSVTANSGVTSRNGDLTIAGVVHAVSQQGRAPSVCTYDISPASASYNNDAAGGTFTVSAPADCPWSAVSHAPWLTLTSADRGTGSGVVSYSVSRNLETTNRTAAVSVADRMFSVSQAGDTAACQYSVAPVDINVCMAGGTVTTTVTAQPNCTWTATSDASWLTVAGGSSGTGTGVVTASARDNYDAPRTGTIMVRWPTPTQGQNVRVAEAGCRYAVSRSVITVAAAGGAGTFDVIQQSDPTQCGGPTQDQCVWSAVSTVPWITITGSMPRAGDNPVSFTVAANPATDARVGTITVRDKVVSITQAGK